MTKERKIHDDDSEPNEYASPACYMHEVDPAYFGLAPPSEAVCGADIARRQKAERDR